MIRARRAGLGPAVALAAAATFATFAAFAPAAAQTAATTAGPQARVIVAFKDSALPSPAPGAADRRSTLADRQALQRRADALAPAAGRRLTAGRALDDRMQVLHASGVDSATLAQRLARDPAVDWAVPDQRRRALAAPNDPLYARAGAAPAARPGRRPVVPARRPTRRSARRSTWRRPGRAAPAAPAWSSRCSTPACGPTTRTWPACCCRATTSSTDVDRRQRRRRPRRRRRRPRRLDHRGREQPARQPVLPAAARRRQFLARHAGVDARRRHRQRRHRHGRRRPRRARAAGARARQVRRLRHRHPSPACCGPPGSSRWPACRPTPTRRGCSTSAWAAAAPARTAYVDAVARINAAGAVVVAAAGNSAGQAVGTPANCPGVIGVGRAAPRRQQGRLLRPRPGDRASARRAATASTSRVGTPCLYPILAGTNSGTQAPNAGGSVWTDSFDISVGTSFASPIVAGAAALMLLQPAGPDSPTRCARSCAAARGRSRPAAPTTGRRPDAGAGLPRARRHRAAAVLLPNPTRASVTLRRRHARRRGARCWPARACSPASRVTTATPMAGQPVTLDGRASLPSLGRSVVGYAWTVRRRRRHRHRPRQRDQRDTAAFTASAAGEAVPCA